MQINVIIKHKEHSKTLCIIAEISHKILQKFVDNCPTEYKHILQELNVIPIEVSMSKKFKTFYAQAYYKAYKKILHTLTIEYAEDLVKFNKRQIRLIVAHELAHSIDFILRGIKNDFKHHDKVWQKIAILLGAQPYPTIEIKKKRVKIYS